MQVLSKCAASTPLVDALSIHAEGTITSQASNTPAAITFELKGRDRVRVDHSVDGHTTFTSIVKGRHGSTRRNGITTPSPLHSTEYARPEQVPSAVCAIERDRVGTPITYVGLEILNGRSVHHIQIGGAGLSDDKVEGLLSEYHLYVDAETFLVLKVRTYAFSPDTYDNRSDWVTTYSDYRKIGELDIPFHIEHSLAGTTIDVIQLTTVRTGDAISDSDFE